MLDEKIVLPRPRKRGLARFAALEERVLGRVMGRPERVAKVGARG